MVQTNTFYEIDKYSDAGIGWSF